MGQTTTKCTLNFVFIQVILKSNTYKDYENYTIEVTNNTENTIYLDDGEDTSTIYIQDSNGVKHEAASSEIIFSTLKEVENTKEFRQILQERGIPISFRKDHRHIDRIVIAGDNVYLVTQRIGGRFWGLVNMELYKQNLLDTLERRNDFFMIIQDNGISKEIYRLWGLIGGSFLLVLFGVSVVAYFLVRLSLKPLEEKIQALNNFIKDSTHEINTPLSIILMSIERIKKEDLKEQDLQKFERIKMAANTLGQIYQDLLFYNFPL